MGCHTWFSVPYSADKEEIVELAQKYLDNLKGSSIGHKKMYQYAIDNLLEEPILELAEYSVDGCHSENWTVYVDIKKWSLLQYNKSNGTNYDSIFDEAVHNKIPLEYYSDEPRIGGYPDKVIRSYDEMVDFMKTGFTDEEGVRHDFYYDEDRKENFMNGIKTFFEKHPKGIITFG